MKERIEKILNDKNLSQAEFADYIGVNRSSITHLMTGRNKSSDTVVARTLLAFPDINPQWLSEGIGEMYKTYGDKSNTPIYPFVKTREFEQENLFSNLDMDLIEDKQENGEIPEQIPFPELDIRSSPKDNPAILPPQQDMKKENQIATITEKQIRKIVFFYTDKTFEEYYPES